MRDMTVLHCGHSQVEDVGLFWLLHPLKSEPTSWFLFQERLPQLPHLTPNMRWAKAWTDASSIAVSFGTQSWAGLMFVEDKAEESWLTGSEKGE